MTRCQTAYTEFLDRRNSTVLPRSTTSMYSCMYVIDELDVDMARECGQSDTQDDDGDGATARDAGAGEQTSTRRARVVAVYLRVHLAY